MELFWTIAKTAARTALVLVAIGLIIGVLTIIPVPSWVDLTAVAPYINKAYTIAVHWIPGFQILWPIGVAIVRAIVAYWLLRAALIVTRFIFAITG